MTAFDYDKLALNAPPAWLALSRCDGERWEGTLGFVEAITEVPSFPDGFFQGREGQLEYGYKFEFVLDDPSLAVVHQYGIPIYNPACLTARKNWFIRYRDILEKHIANPLPTKVFAFSKGHLTDPYCTFRASAAGPFPWPKSKPLPRCAFCQEQLAFMSVLDFRHFSEICCVPVPGQALALHACARCGFSNDPECYALTWLGNGNDIEIIGDAEKSVDLGFAWDSFDFPTVPYSAEELTDDKLFLKEWNFFCIFSCYAQKIGGHIFWIQGDSIPVDRNGQPMRFIGQFFGTPDVEIGDGGIAYVFYSETTGQTELVVQYY